MERWGAEGLLGCPALPPDAHQASQTYLLCRHHGDHVGALFPHHLPELVARMWQWPLCGYVVPLHTACHHLEKKPGHEGTLGAAILGSHVLLLQENLSRVSWVQWFHVIINPPRPTMGL